MPFAIPAVVPTLPAHRRRLPVSHRRALAHAFKIGATAPSGLVRAVVDSKDDLSLMLVDSPGGGGELGQHSAALAIVEELLVESAPLYEVINKLESWVERRRSPPVAIGIFRFSSDEPYLEFLNAGFAPVASVDADGEVRLHLTLSRPIGAPERESHPYQVVQPRAGSTWVLSTNGLWAGPPSLERVNAFTRELHLERWASQLETTAAEDGSRILEAIDRARLNPRGATCLVVHSPLASEVERARASSRPPPRLRRVR